MTVRAVVYDRVSVADPESQTEHLSRCRAFCDAKGWAVVAEEAETVSGFSRSARRPAWERVEAMVRAEEVDAVVVFAVSRAGRNVARFASFVEECHDHGVRFASATEDIDTGGHFGRVILLLLGALAEMESATKRERALVGRDVAARKGTWTGGHRPFGWDVVGGRLVVNAREAFAIRSAATAVLNGGSVRDVTRRWNDDGLTTTVGNPWSRFNVRRTLTAARNAPDILTASDLRKVREVFEARRTGRAPERYLLSGVIVCAEHGTPLNGAGKSYACNRGGEHGDEMHLSVSAARADEVVYEAAFKRAEAQPYEPVEVRDADDEMVRERERIVAALETLGDSDLSEHVLRGRERRLLRDLDAIEAALDEAKPAARGGFLAANPGFPADAPAVLIRQHVARVLVSPAESRRFDPARLAVEWL